MGLRTLNLRRSNLVLWLVALGAAILGLMLLWLLRSDGKTESGTAQVTTFSEASVIYAEFGQKSDSIWQVDAQDPGQRQRLMNIQHAAEYGIVGSLHQESRRLALNVLPVDTTDASPDSPANLLVADLQTGEMRSIASDVDLLIEPVWSVQGDSVVVRRSIPDGYALVAIDTSSRIEIELTQSSSALFPIAYRNNDNQLLYVSLDEAGSDLYSLDLTSGLSEWLAKLSDDLTRDWALAPDESRLAFLSLRQEEQETASQTWVLDLTSSQITPVGSGDTDKFSPVWSDSGVAVGHSPSSTMGVGVEIDSGEATTRLAAPARGFDVPLGFSPSGNVLIVRHFEGASASRPGRPVLTAVDNDGNRTTITTDEVTFLGWINP